MSYQSDAHGDVLRPLLPFYPVITGLMWTHLQIYGHYENSMSRVELSRRTCFAEDRHAVSSCRPRFAPTAHIRHDADVANGTSSAALRVRPADGPGRSTACGSRYWSAGLAGHRMGGSSRAGWRRASSAAKNAWASRPRMVQLRTWCSSRAANSLPTANPSSTFHRAPATFTSWADGAADEAGHGNKA